MIDEGRDREPAFEPIGAVVEARTEPGVVEIRYVTANGLPPDAFFGPASAFGELSASPVEGAAPLASRPDGSLAEPAAGDEAELWLVRREGQLLAAGLSTAEVLRCHAAWRRGEGTGIAVERILDGDGRDFRLGCRIDWGPYASDVAEARLADVGWDALAGRDPPSP